MRALVLPALLLSSFAFVACGGGTINADEPDDTTSSSSSGGSSSGGASGFSGQEPPYGERLDQLADDEFTFIKPAGDTLCSLGTEYGFAVRRGDPSKVVIEFEGGGACWNDSSCSNPASASNTPVYKDTVNAASYAGTQRGLRKSDARNPVDGWTHVIVPYCTADVHWGDKDSTYGTETVHHRGAKNTKAVLDYVYSQITQPERVLVTGCSAGGYGSIYWTPEIRAHYTNSKIRHFSDSAAGVFPGTYFETLQAAWNLTGNLRSELGAGSNFTSLKYLYGGIATTWPDVRTSQYNTLADTTQAVFYSLMGGSGWQAGMLANIAELVRDVPTFNEYMSDGDVHCIIDSDAFYGKEIEGTKLTEWVGGLIGDEPIDNVNCAKCKLPE